MLCCVCDHTNIQIKLSGEETELPYKYNMRFIVDRDERKPQWEITRMRDLVKASKKTKTRV